MCFHYLHWSEEARDKAEGYILGVSSVLLPRFSLVKKECSPSTICSKKIEKINRILVEVVDTRMFKKIESIVSDPSKLGNSCSYSPALHSN